MKDELPSSAGDTGGEVISATGAGLFMGVGVTAGFFFFFFEGDVAGDSPTTAVSGGGVVLMESGAMGVGGGVSRSILDSGAAAGELDAARAAIFAATFLELTGAGLPWGVPWMPESMR